MKTVDIEKLRIAVNQFYLNKYMDQPRMSDSEYDSLAKQYVAEGGSVFHLVEWDEDMKRPNTPLPKVGKDVIVSNDLEEASKSFINRRCSSVESGSYYHHMNYKYDGSSIIAYYTPEGKLHHILGTPDCDICIDRTRNCWNMFPHHINPGIECIQGEFLVDADQFGQLARNKANGLLNSKDMIDELEDEGFIRVYQMRFYDGNWTYERLVNELDNLPRIYRTRVRRGGESLDLIFSPAEMLESAPTEAIIEECIGFKTCDGIHHVSHPKFQVDGIVVYDTLGYHALKFYYTEYADTKITRIEWNRQFNGSYVPKLIIEPIILNGKTISQVSSGGIQNLIACKMGKDAKVRVILSGLTIPKVTKVIETSEDYEWPTCECGHKFSINDIFGGGVKCQGESVCSGRYKMWMNNLIACYDRSEMSSRISWIKSDFYGVLNAVLNIDRVNFNNFKFTEEWKDELIRICTDGNASQFKSMIREYIHSDLAIRILDRNYLTSYSVLHDFIFSIYNV